LIGVPNVTASVRCDASEHMTPVSGQSMRWKQLEARTDFVGEQIRQFMEDLSSADGSRSEAVNRR